VLEEEFLNKLAQLIEAKNISTDATVLERYSRDQSFVTPRKPNYVVWPENTNDVQNIIKAASQYKLPVVPYSSGKNFVGASIPSEGGILVDLSSMKAISQIDEINWNVTVEPGVTFKQLNAELTNHGLRVSCPLMTPPSASVLSTYLERVPVATAADFSYGNELIVDFDVVLPSGELFTVGNPSLPGSPHAQPYGPGINFFRLFVGAQGTLGVVTRMTIRTIPIPAMRRILFMSFDKVSDVLEAIMVIQRREIGLECFALNSFNLASIIAKESAADSNALREGEYVGSYGAKKWTEEQRTEFESLRKALPPWTLLVCLAGVKRFPEEKIAYEEEALKEVIGKLGIVPRQTVAGLFGIEDLFKEELLQPWRIGKKFGHMGFCNSLMFYSESRRVGEFQDILHKSAVKYDYPVKDIGGYILPVERGRAIYCEFDLHGDSNNTENTENVKRLNTEASKALIEAGAFFDRPYGVWADLMYSRTGTYTEYLKKLKAELDPNNIMNPGKLCF